MIHNMFILRSPHNMCVGVDVHAAAKRSQGSEADSVPCVRERTCVWYWYDWLWRREILLLVSTLPHLMKTLHLLIVADSIVFTVCMCGLFTVDWKCWHF